MGIMDKQNQVIEVFNFEDLISTPYVGVKNAINWKRELKGDFVEIVQKIKTKSDIHEVELTDLIALNLTEQGSIARDRIIEDYQLLANFGASPSINILTCYEEDTENYYFPTDVYSFHVDRSPIPSDTFLCTYFGESSEILPNSEAIQKAYIPEIQAELKRRFSISEEEYENFIEEYFFDLHYQAIQNANIIRLGNGNIWRLAIDHPELHVPPCIHRAPREKKNEKRLLLIC